MGWRRMVWGKDYVPPRRPAIPHWPNFFRTRRESLLEGRKEKKGSGGMGGTGGGKKNKPEESIIFVLKREHAEGSQANS